MPYDNPLASIVMKALVKNYFTIGEQGFEVGELTCPLLMKNNFVIMVSNHCLKIFRQKTRNLRLIS